MAWQRDGCHSRRSQNEPTALSRGERVARCGVFTSRSGSGLRPPKGYAQSAYSVGYGPRAGEGSFPRHDPSTLANAFVALARRWRAFPPPLHSHHQRPQENSKPGSAKNISNKGTDITVEGCEKRRFIVVECQDNRGEGGESEH